MKILILCDEVWNDRINGNNVLSNWFEDFDAEFANIYLSPGLPLNNCCNKYFRITDSQMIRSIIKGVRAGEIINEKENINSSLEKYNSTDVKNIGFLRKYCGNTLRLLKNFVWTTGKYNNELLKKFVMDFNPDIIFSARYATGKMLRLEKQVLKYTNCPIVAFTGDNEYSLRRFEFSPVFWINHMYLRTKLKQMMPKYSLYYTLSMEQMEEYKKVFDTDIKVLMKCGNFEDECIKKSVALPIKIVYAGRLYMNRWKTLAEIGKSLKDINRDETKVILDIYTRDNISKKQHQVLNDGKNIFLKGGVHPEELKEIYKKADIALHVESFDLKSRYSTRVSFSTKIIDCLASSCAVMAIAWKQHSGITYLRREDAAICIDDLSKLHSTLTEIANDPNIVLNYQKSAWECGRKNHYKKEVQQKIYKDFEEIINKNSMDCKYVEI